MECNLARNSVWSQLILVLFACYWVTGETELVKVEIVKKINGAINRYVVDRVLDLDGKINNISSTCNAKITSEYNHCELCMKLCGIHEPIKDIIGILIPKPVNPLKIIEETATKIIEGTAAILENARKVADKAVKDLAKGITDAANRVGSNVQKLLQPRIRLPRIAFRALRIRLPRISYRAPRVRFPRVSFRAPRFSRGWGKKRGVQKVERDVDCSCTMCDPLKKDISETETKKRVCGSSFFSESKKLQIERDDSYNIYKFTNNTQFVNKILQDLGSLKNINNKYYLINSIITLSTPNGNEFSIKMTKGMPIGISPLSSTEITEIMNLEGPKVFELLKKNS